MRDQIIEVTNQFPGRSLFSRLNDRREHVLNPDGAFWMRVYPPLCDLRAMHGGRQLCPWSMAAEITDSQTPAERKQRLINALKSGQRTMKLYQLPGARIMFSEDNLTGKISVWVD